MEAPPLECAVKTPHPCGEVTRHVSNQRLSLHLSYGERARRLRFAWLDAADTADY